MAPLSTLCLGIAALAASASPMAMGFVMPSSYSSNMMMTRSAVKMQGAATLNPELTKTYPRDFKTIPLGTAYGTEEKNRKERVSSRG